jgi:energy-coupling factor transport system ATP-binding protein
VKEKSILAFVVEHRLEIALRFATRMIVMLDGRVAADGGPREVLLKAGKVVGYPPVTLAHVLLKRKGLVGDGVPLTCEELAEEVIAKWAMRYS